MVMELFGIHLQNVAVVRDTVSGFWVLSTIKRERFLNTMFSKAIAASKDWFVLL